MATPAETAAQQNFKISLTLLVLIIAFTTLVAGCVHPCQLFSCSRTTNAIAFTGDDGNVYIDIPEFNADQTAALHHIFVGSNPANANSQCCWGIMATLDSPNNRVRFPVRYGADVDGMKATTPMKVLTKGSYQIDGWINFVEHGKFSGARIAGEFTYDGKFVSLK